MKNSAEILCIGTEILLGDIVNTNSAEISRGLAEIGIELYHHTVVGDNQQRLKEALETAFSRSSIVVTTGGLGPTYDDLTKETIAEYFGLALEPHQPSLDAMRCFFTHRGLAMTENNFKQGMVPKGCIVLENRNGTAPGMIIEGAGDKAGKTAILLPGPPREMSPVFTGQVMPYLSSKSEKVLRSHCIYFYGIGESALEAELREQMLSMQNPTLAPYAKEGEVMLRVTASAHTIEEAEALMAPVVHKLLQQYPQYIYGVDVDNLETAVVRHLTEKGLKVATAESCTGGLIAKRITDVSGSSAVLDCGVVSYANAIKTKLLGVSAELLEQEGAVCAEVARQMAQGVRLLSGADIGVATTGIAGPQGGTPEKPVGLVYVAVSSSWHSEVVELTLGGHAGGNRREHIRNLASSKALSLILACSPRS